MWYMTIDAVSVFRIIECGARADVYTKAEAWTRATSQTKPVRVEYLNGETKDLGVVYNGAPKLHVRDRKLTSTVLPWHTPTDSGATSDMCDGTLTTAQAAWADITTCDKCKYHEYAGIGD